MLSIPFKKNEAPSFAMPLKTYIATVYSENPSQYEADIQALQDLRLSLVAPEAHDESAKKHLAYYATIVQVGSKFVFDDEHIKVAFTWASAFSGDFNSSYSIGFEKASLLFNLGSIYCQLAAKEDLESDAGIKRAAALFQQSAGVYSFVSSSLESWSLQGTGQSQLVVLEHVMLAQAQEVFVIKAIVGQMKDGTIAKLAQHASALYLKAYEVAVPLEIFDKAWLCTMQAKSHYLQAIALYRKSLEALAIPKYGEQIAWLNLALEFIKKATDNSLLKNVVLLRFIDDVKALQSTIENALKQANKDNDLIYMEPVPKKEALAEIVAASMVKPTAFPDAAALNSLVAKPLFKYLVPFEVHQAVSEYSSKKDALSKKVSDSVTESIAVAFTTLSSLNLPAAIEALEQPIGLPANLLERSQQVRANGGANGLRNSYQTLLSLSKNDWDILKRAIDFVDAEEREDNSLKVQFADRWTRTASMNLNKNLRESERTLRKKLQDADNANRIVQTKLDNNAHLIENLCLTRDELEASIPASKAPAKEAINDPNVKQLKSLLDALNQSVKRRNDLLTQLKAIAKDDDIGPKLLESLSKSSSFNKSESFQQHMKAYEPLETEITSLINKQDELLSSIAQVNKTFVASRKTNEIITQRENALQALENAYKVFKEVSENIEEGIKFYSEFEPILTKFMDNCKDFAMARDIDKRDAINQIQQSIANMRISDQTSAPTLPPRTNTAPSPQPAYAPTPGAYPMPQATPSYAQHANTAYAPPPGTWQPGQPLLYSQYPPNQQQQGYYQHQPNVTAPQYQQQYPSAPPGQFGPSPGQYQQQPPPNQPYANYRPPSY